jgi:hypothetical protein
MARRLEEWRPVRAWDPIFRGVFASADEITLKLRRYNEAFESAVQRATHPLSPRPR